MEPTNQKEEQSRKATLGLKTLTKLEIWVKRTTVFANIIICLQVVIIGIAYIQYRNAKEYNQKQIETISKNESTKNAIEAINKIYNTEFLNSFAKLNINSTFKDDETRTAFNIVLNNYCLVSIVYNSGIADTILIGKSIKDGINAFAEYPIYSFKDPYIESARVKINKMKDSINKNIR